MTKAELVEVLTTLICKVEVDDADTTHDVVKQLLGALGYSADTINDLEQDD